MLAGNGPDLPGFEEEAKTLGVFDHCIFMGYLERSDLSLVYAMADIFTFPSCTETQGLVTIEAMLFGNAGRGNRRDGYHRSNGRQ